MTDFANRLLGRADAAPVRPLLPSRFEPVTPLRDEGVEPVEPVGGPVLQLSRRPRRGEAAPETVAPSTGWPSIGASTEPAPPKTRPGEKHPGEKGSVETGFVGMGLAEKGLLERRPGERSVEKRPGEMGLAEMRPGQKRLVGEGVAKQPVEQPGLFTGPGAGLAGSEARSWPVISEESVPHLGERVARETEDSSPPSGFPVEEPRLPVGSRRRPTASGEGSVTPAGSPPRPVTQCPEGPLRDVERPDGPLQGIAAAAHAVAAPRAWLPPRQVPDPEPVVHITIGRVEVRATAEPQPAPRRGPRRRQALGLDEYLRRKAGG